MAQLSVAILGLGRIGASIGLALRRYMENGGKYQFQIVGYDSSPDATKQAEKMGAVDVIERKAYQAVEGKDIVIVAMSYEDVSDLYKMIAPDLRDGVVILDASPLKKPSLEWAKEYLSDENHMVGITPILSPKYLFKPLNETQFAEADLFDDSSILISPSVTCIKEAVDLAFNFCSILGSKPRFLDPNEHDTMLALTEGVPNVLGVALFYNLMQNPSWHDLQWFTNPSFGVLTHPLKDTHPDALRDEWMQNSDILARSLDELITTLQTFRDLIQEGDRDAIEAAIVESAVEYEKWINHRYNADWDKTDSPEMKPSNSIMGSLFGEKLAGRMLGRKNDKD